MRWPWSTSRSAAASSVWRPRPCSVASERLVGAIPSAVAARTTRSVRPSPCHSAWCAGRVRSSASSTTCAASAGVGASPRGQRVGQQVGEQHRALRMPGGEHGQLAERRPGVQALGLEAAGEVGDRLVGGQRPDRQRVGLAEERALAGVEELAHHRGLRPRVDVRGGVAVVLDARAQQAVEVLAGDEQVLELVEHDERRDLVAVPERLREVEQVVDDRLGGRGVGLGGRGPTVTRGPVADSDTPSLASRPPRWERIQLPSRWA